MRDFLHKNICITGMTNCFLMFLMIECSLFCANLRGGGVCRYEIVSLSLCNNICMIA